MGGNYAVATINSHTSKRIGIIAGSSISMRTNSYTAALAKNGALCICSHPKHRKMSKYNTIAAIHRSASKGINICACRIIGMRANGYTATADSQALYRVRYRMNIQVGYYNTIAAVYCSCLLYTSRCV